MIIEPFNIFKYTQMNDTSKMCRTHRKKKYQSTRETDFWIVTKSDSYRGWIYLTGKDLMHQIVNTKKSIEKHYMSEPNVPILSLN